MNNRNDNTETKRIICTTDRSKNKLIIAYSTKGGLDFKILDLEAKKK